MVGYTGRQVINVTLIYGYIYIMPSSFVSEAKSLNQLL